MRKYFTIIAIALLSTQAQAKDLLRCETAAASLVIYEVVGGYEFLFESANYLRKESIERSPAHGHPSGRQALAFKNAEVKIIRLYGEYVYLANNRDERFPIESCVLNP